MIIDARRTPLPDTPDVLVVGAGPAGITLALELEGSGLEVVVLESGGIEESPAIEELNDAESAGIPYSIGPSRRRVLGGTSSIWTGQVRPLEQVDMEQRDGVHDLGWPIRRSSLDDSYTRAAEILEVGPEPFDLEHWRERLDQSAAPIVETDLLTTTLFRLSPPTRLGQRYKPELEISGDVTVALHATALELITNPRNPIIDSVRVALGSGDEQIVRPAVTVLAGGALEVTRLLLASRSKSADGVANSSGLVGRGFMEHPHTSVATLATTDRLPDVATQLFYGTGVPVDDRNVIGFMSLRPDVLRGEGLLHCGLKATIRTDTPQPRNAAVSSLTSDVEGRPVGTVIDLFLQAETRWNPDSRATLGPKTDALGMPRLRLDWQLDERDVADYMRTIDIVGLDLARNGFGRIRPHARSRSEFPEPVGFHHHLGTTRMSADPSEGVVDELLTTHDSPNLYIASSSVFPTGGFANPTLTIVALAVRLARFLRSEQQP